MLYIYMHDWEDSRNFSRYFMRIECGAIGQKKYIFYTVFVAVFLRHRLRMCTRGVLNARFTRMNNTYVPSYSIENLSIFTLILFFFF